MKILLVDPSLYTPPYDGALASALEARGHDVTLLGRRLRSSDPPLGGVVRLVPLFYARGERLRRAGSTGAASRIVKGLEHVGGLRNLSALVARERPDVVHWQWPSLPLLDAAALAWLRQSVPQVVTVHDARVFKAKRGLRRAMSLGWQRFLLRADRVIAHVDTTRAALVDMGVPAERIAIVPHPVFARTRSDPPAALDPRLVHVAFFGRLSDDKGLDVLADALAKLPQASRERVRVHVWGPPIREDRRVAAALARLGELPFVRLRPQYVTEESLDGLLSACDLVVLPHREVDASGMLMKALAYDVGLVASDVRAFREVLGTSPGVEWFRCGDPGALSASLHAVVGEPGRRVAMRAATRALRTHALSWAHAAELTERVYRGLLGHAPAEVAIGETAT